jgi:hypothetical protein
MTTTQQNYPVHKQEMLAGLESMLWHRDILQGTNFCWYTDYKGLMHLLKQRRLSGRQARWMEAFGNFSFKVIYIEGTENILANALSQLYSNDLPGTERSPSEYVQYDEDSPPPMPNDKDDTLITAPLFVGLEAAAVTT